MLGRRPRWHRSEAHDLKHRPNSVVIPLAALTVGASAYKGMRWFQRSRQQLQLDIEQPAFGVWDPLSDRSMSCCVGPRAPSDRKPNW